MENMVSKVHEAINTVCGANDRRMDHLLDDEEYIYDKCEDCPHWSATGDADTMVRKWVIDRSPMAVL